MKFTWFCFACIGVLFGVMMLAGCDGTAAPYGVVPIAGSAHYDGKPIPKGFKVEFTPEDGRRSSVGIIGDAGKFTAIHTASQDGVPTGKCKVNVSLLDPMNGKAPDELAGMLKAYGFDTPGLPLEISKKNMSLKIDFPKVD